MYLIRRLAIAVTAVVTVVAFCPAPARAAITHTYDGANGGLWSLNTNWDDDITPVDGDSVILPDGLLTVDDLNGLELDNITIGNHTVSGAGVVLGVTTSINNTGTANIGADLDIAGANVTISTGATLTLQGDISGTGDITKAGLFTLNLVGNNSFDGDLIVSSGAVEIYDSSGLGSTAGNTTVASGGYLILNGDNNAAPVLSEDLVLIGTGGGAGAITTALGEFWLSGDITLSGATTIAPSFALALLGTISGTGPLTITGPASDEVDIEGNNTYSGGTVLTNAKVVVTTDDAFGSGAVTISDGSQVTADDDITIANALTIAGNGFAGEDSGAFIAPRTVELTGAIAIGSGATFNAINADAEIIISGVISGTGGLVLGGPGSFSIEGTASNTYTGNTSIPGVINSILGSTEVTLDKTAGLNAVTGNVTVGPNTFLEWDADNQIPNASNLTNTGGIVDFNGNDETITTFSSNGAYVNLGNGLMFSAVSTGNFTLANSDIHFALGNTAGAFDTVTVTGTVNLGPAGNEAGLDLDTTTAPAIGSVTVIVINDGSDPIVGTFEDLAEGDTVGDSEGNEFIISYVGGTGNDISLTRIQSQGYRLVASDGGVFTYGTDFFGSAGGIVLNRPIVGGTATASGDGYWLVASDGGVFSYGDAAFYGSMGGTTINKPVVGMAVTPSGNGYWLVASDGGVFSFGDAAFRGSMGGSIINKPMVAMLSNGDAGYWLVAADGGVFSFGNAGFYGSTGGITLNQPIVGAAAAPSGDGYRFVASDGGVFNFGSSIFYGSPVVATAAEEEDDEEDGEGDVAVSGTVVDIENTDTGEGYWVVTATGAVFAFGDAAYLGGANGKPLNRPIVEIIS